MSTKITKSVKSSKVAENPTEEVLLPFDRAVLTRLVNPEHEARQMTIDLVFEQKNVKDVDGKFLRSVYKLPYLRLKDWKKYERITDKYLPTLVIEQGYQAPDNLDPNVEVEKLIEKEM
jgi:hypothetical protein